MSASNHTPVPLEPLAHLALELQLAAQAFDPNSADGGRAYARASVGAVLKFLMARFEGPALSALVPLRHLQYALHDLDNGKVTTMLRPKKVAHRPRDPVAVDGFRAFAAVAMDLFMDAEVGREQAARDVAHELSRKGYTEVSGKMITWRRVEDWRDRMRRERPAEDEVAARFARMKPDLEKRFPSDPKAAARHLLEQLPLAVPIPKKPPS
jgi:hypothetical protein